MQTTLSQTENSSFWNFWRNDLVSFTNKNIRNKGLEIEKICINCRLSSKTNISFQVISRGFGVYVSFASSLIMLAGFFIGVYKTSPADTGNFGVLIVLLTAMSDYLQYFLKQIITV